MADNKGILCSVFFTCVVASEGKPSCIFTKYSKVFGSNSIVYHFVSVISDYQFVIATRKGKYGPGSGLADR